jgi:hypothetical protein
MCHVSGTPLEQFKQGFGPHAAGILADIPR